MKISQLIQELKSLGFTKERFYNMYKIELLANSEISKELNDLLDSNTIGRKQIESLLKTWEITKRTKEETNIVRSKQIQKTKNSYSPDQKLYGKDNCYSINDVLSLYSNDQLSLEEIYRRTGVSPQTSRKMIVKAGGTIRIQQSHYLLLKDLENAGAGELDIRQRYQTENMLAPDVRAWMTEIVGYEVGTKAFDTLLNRLDIKKTPEQIKHLQGNKSRKEKADNLKKLRRAGFYSPQTLADYFDANKHITRHRLLRLMNSQLFENEVKFTNRWLERNMDPLLNEDRLRGTSRIEKEFILALREVTVSTVIENSRSFITPYELDALLPDLGVAFEFNGDWWHSDKFLQRNHGMSSVEYHVQKKNLCAAKGVKLFFVWESDWIDRQDEVVLAMIDVMVDPSLEPGILCRLEPAVVENEVEGVEVDFSENRF